MKLRSGKMFNTPVVRVGKNVTTTAQGRDASFVVPISESLLQQPNVSAPVSFAVNFTEGRGKGMEFFHVGNV